MSAPSAFVASAVNSAGQLICKPSGGGAGGCGWIGVSPLHAAKKNRVTARVAKRMSTSSRVSILIVLAVSLGITPIQAQKDPVPPQGPVQASGRAVADAGGPFPALGATLFW